MASAMVLLSCSSGTSTRHTASARSSAPNGSATVDDGVRLNQIQVIGTHNSYHELLSAAERKLRDQVNKAGVAGLDYRHAPLPVQLQTQRVRQVELDVWLDTKGGRFATPLLRSATGGGPADPVMRKPGIKVFHVQDTDYHSTCLTLKICLSEIRDWSDAHPSHLPIAILVELKDSPEVFGNIKFATPEPWTAPAMNTLDAEIRSVLRAQKLITPDDVKGSRATLRDSVLHSGWPTLRQSRGRVLFLMDDADKRVAYLKDHPGLAGRVLFTNSIPGEPDAAFVERNEAKRSKGDIRSLVRQGYVVRTMADHETHEAHDDDLSSRDAALTSGAQWISTDYPVPNYGVGFATKYVVQLPGGTVARCNPVNAPRGCRSADLDKVFTPPPTSAAPPTTTR